MSTITAPRSQPVFDDRAYTLQIAVPDLGPLMRDKFGLEINSLSPVYQTLKGYPPQSIQPADPGALEELASDPRALEACRIIAQPVLQMGMRVGGPQGPGVYWSAHLAPDVSPTAIVLALPGPEATLHLKLFEQISDFIAWFSSSFASSNTTNVPNYLPPPLSLESTIYILHAIDCFQRQALKQSLTYGGGDEPLPPITASEFQESLGGALASKSHRWLLSSFLACAPDLDLIEFEPSAEHIASLATYDFLRPSADGATLEFGEAGAFTGAEFYGTWPLAVGIRIMTLSSNHRENAAYRAFLAPTALTNHLFKLEFGADGGCNVNHQTKSQTSLEAELHQAIADALESRNDVSAAEPSRPHYQPSPPTRRETSVPGSASPAPATPEPTACAPEPQAGPATRYCFKCGAGLDNPDAAFCGKCGAKL